MSDTLSGMYWYWYHTNCKIKHQYNNPTGVLTVVGYPLKPGRMAKVAAKEARAPLAANPQKQSAHPENPVNHASCSRRAPKQRHRAGMVYFRQNEGNMAFCPRVSIFLLLIFKWYLVWSTSIYSRVTRSKYAWAWGSREKLFWETLTLAWTATMPPP